MFDKNSDGRFQVIYKEGTFSGSKIIIDKKTGVNYLFCWDGQAGGVTPLLDGEGKPIITNS